MSPIDLTGGEGAVPADQNGQMVRPGDDANILDEMVAAIEGDEPEEIEAEAETEDEVEAEDQEEVVEETEGDEVDEVDLRRQELDARKRELDQREQSLETERRIKNLLRYKGFREEMQALIQRASQDPEFDWGRKDLSDDGVRETVKGFKDDRLDEIKPVIDRMAAKLAEIEQVEERGALNAMRDDFKSTFGDVVTDEEWSAVERKTLSVYGDKISREAVELMAFKHFSKKGVTAKANSATEKVKSALAAQPKGTRIVNAATTAKQAKPKLPDPRKMTDADIIREMESSIYS